MPIIASAFGNHNVPGHRIASGTSLPSKPAPTEGKAFFDTGVALITDKPVEGVESIDTAKGTELCWG